jgi:hypothetical protein
MNEITQSDLDLIMEALNTLSTRLRHRAKSHAVPVPRNGPGVFPARSASLAST